jgi:iron complex outermembrane receptor protein
MGSGCIPVAFCHIALLILLAALPAAAQTPARTVHVTHDGAPVAGASIKCGAASTATDKDGRASIAVPDGGCELVVSKERLAPVTRLIAAGTGAIEVELEALPEVEEAVVVVATRTGRLAGDQALRVEVVGREEIEEKLLMTPGDIAMLLNETSGIRLQATSPALGAATVRVQGLSGRYTSVLTDGLPINSTQVSALGLLQVPPMDLKQVEVIKGAASALYGASALGGLINLVSRTPGESRQIEGLFNVTSRGGADAVLWAGLPAGERWGMTLLAGVHTQNRADVDDDGWSDLPEYRRGLIRPRVTVAGEGWSAEATGGVLRETREGGTHGSSLFVQAVDTWRRDAGFTARRVSGALVMTARASVSFIRHDHQYGDDRDRDDHGAQFAELAITRGVGAHTFVVGAAVERQTFESSAFARFAYRWTTPGLFVQDDWTIAPRWTVSASARVDRHPDYGSFVSPRVSSLIKVLGWDARLSYGAGFFAPAPLTEETDEVGLRYVDVPSPLRAERGRTWSVDLTRALGPLSVSVSGFGARIRDALAADTIGDRLVLTNRDGASRTSGAELFGRFRRGPLVVTASHAWVRATEIDADGVRADVPLTPRRTFGLVAAWERHGRARVGLEVYRTGAQRLEDNPFAGESEPYTIVGLLAERRVGRARVFINLENLRDVRLSDTHPFLRPQPTATGRRTVDAWAPLEGRTINGGIRFDF